MSHKINPSDDPFQFERPCWIHGAKEVLLNAVRMHEWRTMTCNYTMDQRFIAWRDGGMLDHSLCAHPEGSTGAPYIGDSYSSRFIDGLNRIVDDAIDSLERGEDDMERDRR